LDKGKLPYLAFPKKSFCKWVSVCKHLGLSVKCKHMITLAIFVPIRLDPVLMRVAAVTVFFVSKKVWHITYSLRDMPHFFNFSVRLDMNDSMIWQMLD